MQRRQPRGGGGAPRDAVRLRLASGFVLATDPSSIVQAAADANNGIALTLRNSAASRDLPSTGACWVRAGVHSPTRQLVSPWTPSLRPPQGLLMERAAPSVTAGLVRLGMLWMNTASPATATEGFGFYVEYPSTTLRQVGIVRVTGTGTWSAASTTTATGRSDHFGAQFSTACGGLAGIQGLHCVGVDINGDAASPLGSNKATHTPLVTTTAGTGWHTGFFAGWTNTGGTDGVTVTCDPMYWLADRENRG